nr:39S ribosomal protein L38, mitochondrial-like [Leptinotarsa decemlineata]
MASSMWKLCRLNLNGNIGFFSCGQVRSGHHLRGRPPGVARSLDQVLAEKNYKDPAIHFRVDIGLPPPVHSRSKRLEERLRVFKEQKKNSALEKLARKKQLFIDLEETKKEWMKTVGPNHIKNISDHYGVYEHLFGDAYFYNRVPLSVTYDKDDGKIPVCFGNIIKPIETSKKPCVTYECEDNTFWSLILTNPDGHFTESDSEYIHWFVGNIPGNAIEKGETLIEYLQPFPPKGTGYHRLIFVLYKQEKELDFSSFKREGLCLDLSQRTFSTYNFYKNNQDDLTPAGLAFFQTDWDPSLKKFYHDVLDMKEPIFEYDFPPPHIRKQEWFPLRKPFNLYLDKYRDPKQINKEFLMRKMKNVHPFKEPPPPVPYPNAEYFEGYIPTWLKLEMRKSKLKWGRINDIE